MQNKLKDISNVNINELSYLSYEIIDLINTKFSHVSEHFPQSIKDSVYKFIDKLEQEMDKRDM